MLPTNRNDTAFLDNQLTRCTQKFNKINTNVKQTIVTNASNYTSQAIKNTIARIFTHKVPEAQIISPPVIPS